MASWAPRPGRRRPSWRIGGLVVVLLFTAGLALGVGPLRGAPPSPPIPGAPAVSAWAPLRAPAVHAHPGVVLPSYGAGYSEPAPMGITDFGVTPSGVPYTYATPKWLGTVTVRSLTVTDGGATPTYMTFQLNVVLVLHAASGNFTYWVQNVVSLDSKGDSIGFVNNIWNFSSPSAGLTSSELSGNGTVNYDPSVGYWYAYSDTNPGDGNGVALTLPATISAEVTTGIFNGLPHVSFRYNDGVGWYTYDNVTFEHGRDWTDSGYVVDGFRYAPIADYIFLDGEWDFSGGGSDYTDVLSNLSMELQYWNGHNFQEPRTAWDFGGNTGESMTNVVPSLTTNPGNGTLTAQETNGTAVTLGPLYGTSDVATLDATMPGYPNGSLEIGTSQVPYVGGAANLTLAPGSYKVGLWEDGAPVGNAENLTLTGGEALDLVLPGAFANHTVTVGEAGLPVGTLWSATLSAGTFSTRASGTGPSLAFSVQNGSYQLVVAPVAGYVPSSYGGVVDVRGDADLLNVTWSMFLYGFAVGTSGLAPGTPWNVTVNGTTPGARVYTAAGSGIVPVTLRLPNGTYYYNVTTVRWYAASPSGGFVTIAAGPASATVDFGTAASTLLAEVTPTNASLSVDGVDESAAEVGGVLRLVLAPGTHTVLAAAPGYQPLQEQVATTPGNVTTVLLDLSPTPGPGPGHGAGGTGGTGSGPDWTFAYVGLAAGAVVAVGLLALLLRRPPPRR